MADFAERTSSAERFHIPTWLGLCFFLGVAIFFLWAYAYVRHPQYTAFILIMFGFLLQWPIFVTIVMFPILVTVYVRLAHREERGVRAEFGPVWDRYAAQTPGFIPRLGRGVAVGQKRDAQNA